MANPLGKFFQFGQSALWQKKDNRVIGLDLGHSSVKAVQLRREKGRVILETYGEMAVGPYGDLAVGQVSNLTSVKMAELIGDLFREANITARAVSLAIPLRSSLLLIIDLPQLNSSQLDKVIPIEARKYIPVPISEVELDWWVIPQPSRSETTPAIEAKKVEVLIAAIHKEVINQYTEHLKSLQLSPAFFEIETFSAIRSIFSGERGATVILDLGAGTTKLAIVDQGIVRISHTISKGAQDITLAISRSLGLEFAKAEEIKRSVGLLERYEGQNIAGLASAIIEYIFAEAHKVLTIYQTRQRRSVEKVILIGNGALLTGLVELAGQSFEVPVTLGLPFAKVEYPTFLEGVLSKTGPGFAVAVGLALRHLENLD
ncbi:MAG: type IV pilus assembly protein PilM [Candidatus Vogelbacteria bacterium]|nr:type IV pilus assembly protein PilM [Candidatus Vogelbacteria bacterium]